MSAIASCTGTLTRDFKHLAVDMYKTQDDVEDEEGEVTKGPLKLRVDCHFGKRKRLAAIRTCTSHVQVNSYARSLYHQQKFRCVLRSSTQRPKYPRSNSSVALKALTVRSGKPVYCQAAKGLASLRLPLSIPLSHAQLQADCLMCAEHDQGCHKGL